MRLVSFFFFTGCIFFVSHTANAQDLEPNPNLRHLVIAFKTHFDIGYTDYAEAVEEKYSSSMIASALEILDESRQGPENERFVWTMPAWPMEVILERSSPEVRQQVGMALKEGYFAVHALPFTLETEASDMETLVRSLEISSNISKTYDLELPRDAKMTDVPSHSWIWPTILTNSGVKILHLGCNPASRSPEVPLLFWWEGPDGSRLMTMYWGKYYGTDLVPPKEWPHQSWLAIIHTNDNQGPPSALEVRKVLEQAKTLAPNAEISIGRISDFYDLLIEEKPELPVVRGDMPDTWIHGYMSMPREVKASRRMRKDMFALEMLHTQMNTWKGEHKILPVSIAETNENSLLFDEHTFGLAMSHGHSGIWVYGDEFRQMKAQDIFAPIEHSWKEKGNRVFEVEKKIIPAYEHALTALAASVEVEGPHIVVYNPLPWKRTGHVKLQMLSRGIHGTLLKDISTGALLPFSNRNNVIEFIATQVPSMGYKTYIPIEGAANPDEGLLLDVNNGILENKFYRVKIDPSIGGISSLVDKRNGREWVSQESEFGFGGYMYERFSKENTESYARAYIKGGWNWAPAELGRPNLTEAPYERIVKKPARINYEGSAIKKSAVMHVDHDDDNPYNYSIIVSIYRDLPYVEITWAIDGKTPEPWPEAGWITMPVNARNPKFKLGRLGAVVDPATDFIKGSNFDYYFLNSGMSVVDESGSCLSLFSPDAPGMSLDRPGLWQYSGDFLPRQSNVFFNLYNNQWSTNFTEWIEGSWSATFYIQSFEAYENEAAIIGPSENFRQPLRAGFSAGGSGDIALMQEGISISEKGMLLTGFGPNPNGKGLFFRIWEQAGKSGTCIVIFPEKMKVATIQPVDLRGNEVGEPLPVKDNTARVQYTAYKPYTFIIQQL